MPWKRANGTLARLARLLISAMRTAYQAMLYPAMLELSDVPTRYELADQLHKATGLADPDQQGPGQLQGHLAR